jgi:hypothetical protein
MNTNPSISEAEVVAWLREQAEGIISHSGVRQAVASVSFFADTGAGPFAQFTVHAGDSCAIRNSMAEAIGALLKKVGTPEELAEQKRQAARKLMAEADAISPPVYIQKAAA